MTDKEIHRFVEEMAEIGDFWTVEQVKRVFGSLPLKEALSKRKEEVSLYLDILTKVNHK